MPALTRRRRDAFSLENLQAPGLRVLSSGGGASGLSAPVLTWTSDTTDLTPEGTIQIGATFGVGDTVLSEIKLSSQNWADVVPTSREITPDKDVTDLVTLGLSALAPGSYDWRIRLRASDSLYTDYSNIESKTLVSSNNRTSATGDRRISATGVVRVYA